MVVHGYTLDSLHGFNSWGESWGHEGSFFISPSLVKYYIIPGKIEGEGPGYPYPLPPAIFKVTMGGFSDAALNGNYELFLHSWGYINGHNSFWKSDSVVMYWCRNQNRWALAKLDHVSLKDARFYLEQDNVWSARSPLLTDYDDMERMGTFTGWTEKGVDSSSNDVKGIVRVWKDSR